MTLKFKILYKIDYMKFLGMIKWMIYLEKWWGNFCDFLWEFVWKKDFSLVLSKNMWYIKVETN